MKCERCNGLGACQSSGEIEIIDIQSCPDCNGTGQQPEKPLCTTCEDNKSRITELSECNKLLREIWLTDVGKIAELKQQRDDALSIVKLACKATDYRKRHQHKLIYEEIEILKIMNERTADNRQEGE